MKQSTYFVVPWRRVENHRANGLTGKLLLSQTAANVSGTEAKSQIQALLS